MCSSTLSGYSCPRTTRTMPTRSQRVLIVQDATREPCVISLQDVVHRLSLKSGDKIELLGIIPAFTEDERSSTKKCGFLLNKKSYSALVGKVLAQNKTHSSATINKHNKHIEEEMEKTLERYTSSAEFKEMLKISEAFQVEFEIAVKAGLQKEVAVEYAKRIQATHVILHRQLGKEWKYFSQNLPYGISRMKSDNCIEIVRPPQEDEDGTVEEATPNLEIGGKGLNDHFACSFCTNRRPWLGPKKKFTYAELQIATNGFSLQSYVLGQGKRIYLGLFNHQRQILIKELPSVTIKEWDFQKEVQILEGLRHENVASLIGSCSEGPHRFLVYEYVCNGSLNKHLSSKNRELTWERRVSIIYGAAKGLEYLHEERIYGSMRPSNILITHDYQPLLCYYGFTNQYEATEQSYGKSAVKTFEHLAPEYQETGRELCKADVYSFGVVLLELITGRKSIEDTDGQSFLRWARPLLKQRKYMELIDPEVPDSVDVYQLLWLVRVADKCLSWDPKNRYSMKKVVTALTGMTNRFGVEDFSPNEFEL